MGIVHGHKWHIPEWWLNPPDVKCLLVLMIELRDKGAYFVQISCKLFS